MADLSPCQRLEQRAEIEGFFKEPAKEVLFALARNPHLQERDLLRLLERRDLPHEVVRELANRQEARRGTGPLAAGLLISTDPELIRAALDNAYLTEGPLLKVLAHENLPPALTSNAEPRRTDDLARRWRFGFRFWILDWSRTHGRKRASQNQNRSGQSQIQNRRRPALPAYRTNPKSRIQNGGACYQFSLKRAKIGARCGHLGRPPGGGPACRPLPPRAVVA